MHFPNLDGVKRIALDTETHDPDLKTLGAGVRRGGYICGISLAAERGQGISSWYLPIAHASGNLDRELVLTYMRSLAATYSGELLGANILYDLDYLAEIGIEFKHAKIIDIQHNEALIDEWQVSYSLDNIAKKYGFPGKDEFELDAAFQQIKQTQPELLKRLGIKTAKGAMSVLPADVVAKYARIDAELCLLIYKNQQVEIQKQDLSRIVKLERDVWPVVFAMRRLGVAVDIGKIEHNAEILTKQINQHLFEMQQDVPLIDIDESTLTNPKKLVLALGVKTPLTPTGQPQVTNDWLEMQDQPCLRILSRARKLLKTRDNFVTGILPYVTGGRIHVSFNQLRGSSFSGKIQGVGPGRMSCIAEGQPVMVPGGDVAIENIKVGDVVYTYRDGIPHTSKVLNTFNNGKLDCLSIKWRSTGNRGVIGELVCTPDHKILTRDRGWVCADKLLLNEKLIHLRRSHRKATGRVRMYGANNYMVLEEQLLKRAYFTADSHMHIHHIDGDKANNKLDNLIVLSAKDHGKLHAKERLAAGGIRWEHLLTCKRRFLYGEQRPNWIATTKFSLLRMLSKARGRLTFASIDFNTLKKKCKLHQIDIKKVCARYSSTGVYLSEANLLKAMELHSRTDHAATFLGIGTRKLKSLCNYYGLCYNHEVVSITPVGVRQVYDIEVERDHNFIASEICVHNCSAVNLQQIPARDPVLGPMVRSQFIADAGKQFCAIDFSQQEPRMALHYAAKLGLDGADALLSLYKANKRQDSYTPIAQVAGIDRSAAKAIMLGISYGMGGGKLCRQLGFPTKMIKGKKGDLIEVAGSEGQAVIDAFDFNVPYVRELAKRVKARAEEVGYIRTIGGRVCRLEKGSRGEYMFTYKAFNNLMQGSGADMTKQAMVDMHAAGYTPQLQVHDELCLSVTDSRQAKICAEIMEQAIPTLVPSCASVELGPSWGELKEID